LKASETPVAGLAPLRTAIGAYVTKARPPAAKGPLDWVVPALTTTDAAVAAYLKTNPPEDRFDPCMFESHLSEASAMLDRCLARQNEIFALETQAMTTLLDYALAENLQTGDLSLAKVGLKATRAQAHAGAGDADEPVLTEQNDFRTQARNVRLALHNTDGHPLNYGQRIDFLRDMYGDTVRTIYERLNAARYGLHASGVALNQPPLPVWTATNWENLKALVTWCRNAIRAAEATERNEVGYWKNFAIGYLGYFTGGQKAVQDRLAFPGDVTFDFAIPSGQFETGTTRILELGVSLGWGGTAHDLNDLNWTLKAEVTLPPQVATFATPAETHTWSRPKVLLRHEVTPFRRIGLTTCPSGARTQVVNTNPVGNWSIAIPDEVRYSDGTVGKRSMCTFTEVMLFMYVATRKAS
jgi:hypothetical protein